MYLHENKKGGPFAVVYQPGGREVLAEFDFFCEVAYALGDLLLVVEEEAQVTMVQLITTLQINVHLAVMEGAE